MDILAPNRLAFPWFVTGVPLGQQHVNWPWVNKTLGFLGHMMSLSYFAFSLSEHFLNKMVDGVLLSSLCALLVVIFALHVTWSEVPAPLFWGSCSLGCSAVGSFGGTCFLT